MLDSSGRYKRRDRKAWERVAWKEAFAREVCHAGFTHVMLLGMGGSSLCPEVLRRTFGRRDDLPELLVLDTTDPDTIAEFLASAQERFRDGVTLAERGRRTAAIYLWGYAA